MRLLGITGDDTIAGYRDAVQPLGIDCSGVVVSGSRTFTWHAVHDFERWVTASEHSDPGCDDEWDARLDAASAAAEVLFLGSMEPRLQQVVLRQSSARLIACDTMTVFAAAAPGAVREVIAQSDVVFLNRAELSSLTGSDDWRSAAASLLGARRPRAVVVKAGPLGAALVTVGGVVERPAHPVAAVADPTGAGDALAGGFLGHCAAESRDDDDAFVAALDHGIHRAAAAITSFGFDDLLSAAGASRPSDV